LERKILTTKAYNNHVSSIEHSIGLVVVFVLINITDTACNKQISGFLQWPLIGRLFLVGSDGYFFSKKLMFDGFGDIKKCCINLLSLIRAMWYRSLVGVG